MLDSGDFEISFMIEKKEAKFYSNGEIYYSSLPHDHHPAKEFQHVFNYFFGYSPKNRNKARLKDFKKLNKSIEEVIEFISKNN
jgi:hypothetical protein